MSRNLISDIASFLRFAAGSSPRRLQWDPDGARSDGEPATVLVVDDTIPRPPFRSGAARRLAVSSAAHRLSPSRFGVDAGAINRVGAKGHGRTLTCLAGHEPISALSFHLDQDPSAVLLVTDIAVLSANHPSAEVQLSQAMAGALLCYLSAAAMLLPRDARLGYAPNDARLATALGFRRCAPPPAYAAAGSRYMEWRPAATVERLIRRR